MTPQQYDFRDEDDAYYIYAALGAGWRAMWEDEIWQLAPDPESPEHCPDTVVEIYELQSLTKDCKFWVEWNAQVDWKVNLLIDDCKYQDDAERYHWEHMWSNT